MSTLQGFWKTLKILLWHVAHEYLFDLEWFVGPVLIWSVAKFRVEGPGRVPRKGGVLLTANHKSQWDLVAVTNISPRAFYQMAKVEFFEFFFVGGLVRLIGAFPVNRGKADRQALNRAIQLIKDGQLLTIFPEGHRSDTYALIEAHKGAALIALQADALIIPVGIWGTELVSRKTEWKQQYSFFNFFKRRPQVVVKIGEAYRLPKAPPGQKDDLDELTDLIMSKIAELLPPEYQGEYSAEKLAERQAAREKVKAEKAAKQAERRAAARVLSNE